MEIQNSGFNRERKRASKRPEIGWECFGVASREGWNEF
jgi:hypothetical protein